MKKSVPLNLRRANPTNIFKIAVHVNIMLVERATDSDRKYPRHRNIYNNNNSNKKIHITKLFSSFDPFYGTTFSFARFEQMVANIQVNIVCVKTQRNESFYIQY